MHQPIHNPSLPLPRQAKDLAYEDTILALDKLLQAGQVPLDVYLKQVGGGGAGRCVCGASCVCVRAHTHVRAWFVCACAGNGLLGPCVCVGWEGWEAVAG